MASSSPPYPFYSGQAFDTIPPLPVPYVFPPGMPAGSNARQGVEAYATDMHPCEVPSWDKEYMPDLSSIQDGTKKYFQSKLDSGDLSKVEVYKYGPNTQIHLDTTYEHGHDIVDKSVPAKLAECQEYLSKQLAGSNTQTCWINLESKRDEVLCFILSKTLGEYYQVAYLSIKKPKQRVTCQIFNKSLFLLAKIPMLKNQYIIPRYPDEDEDAESSKGETQEQVSAKKNLKERLLKNFGTTQASCTPNQSTIVYERIAFIMQPATGLLLTIQGGRDGDLWGPLRDELNDKPHGFLRTHGVNVLAWRLLSDTLRACEDIDNSFGAVLEDLIQHIDTMQQWTVTDDDRRLAASLKREMDNFRRRITPLGLAFERMADETWGKGVIEERYRPYFEDLHNQALRIMDNIECHYQDSVDLLTRFSNLDAQRDGKLQFIISMALAFFSPLSFIVGLYGMNFQGDPITGTGGMPELTWYNGYTFVWILMGVVVAAIIIAFVLLGVIPIPDKIRIWSRKASENAKLESIPPTGSRNTQTGSAKSYDQNYQTGGPARLPSGPTMLPPGRAPGMMMSPSNVMMTSGLAGRTPAEPQFKGVARMDAQMQSPYAHGSGRSAHGGSPHPHPLDNGQNGYNGLYALVNNNPTYMDNGHNGHNGLFALCNAPPYVDNGHNVQNGPNGHFARANISPRPMDNGQNGHFAHGNRPYLDVDENRVAGINGGLLDMSPSAAQRRNDYFVGNAYLASRTR